MDQHQAPILDALAEHHRLDRYGFTPPGHRQGRGADKRTMEVLGADTSAPISWPRPVWMTGPPPAATSSRRRN
jgi:hypothetical protein